MFNTLKLEQFKVDDSESLYPVYRGRSVPTELCKVHKHMYFLEPCIREFFMIHHTQE